MEIQQKEGNVQLILEMARQLRLRNIQSYVSKFICILRTDSSIRACVQGILLIETHPGV